MQRATQRLKGAYAIAVFCRDEPQRVVGAREGSPLILGLGEGENLRIGISNGLVCEKPGKPDSALGGQPMPAWMAWNWRLGRCLVWIRPALTARLALVGP